MNKKTSDYFITKESRSIFEKSCLDAIKMANDFKLDLLERPLINYKDQKSIINEIFEEMPEDSLPLPIVLEEFKNKILNGSTNWSSPNFLAYPDSSNAMATNLGHILQGMTSQNLCNSLHTSPTATIVEIQIIKWLRKALGFTVKKDIKSVFEIGGIYTPGGVLSNTIGMLLAREKKFKNTMKEGICFDPSKVKIFLPESIGHYSSKCAAGWLGLGLNSIKLVKTSNNFCFDLDALETNITSAIREGYTPLAVVSYAGDSRTMAVDDFKKIHSICKKYDLWMHVDACHGSALAFSEKNRHLIDGIELADSVTLDPHKIFWMPLNLSYILLKNPENFKLISGSSDLVTNEPLSLGQISPFIGSWGFHSLKLWFLIKNMGRKAISQFIDRRTDIAKNLSSKINSMNNFYTLNDIVINSITFIYIPKDLLNKLQKDNIDAANLINKLNKKIRETLFREKSIFIHTFPLKDYKKILKTNLEIEFQMLRIMISNPLFNKDVEDNLLKTIQSTAKEVFENEFKH